MMVLFQAMWPRAFHGISVCTLGWSHVVHLRSAAMKALRFNKAGSHAGARLALLSSSPLCDPGYFQAYTVLTTFKRMLQKQPTLELMWGKYMYHWTGTLTQGPFGKLLEITRMIGWQVCPPHLMDHDGVLWHLSTCDQSGLIRTLREAWAQFVAADLVRRKDFAGLQGVDYDVLQMAQRKLLPHDRAWLSVLRAGTFVDQHQQAKYDVSKAIRCPFCGALDSVDHRTFHCPRIHAERTPFLDLVAAAGSWPIALRTRLLPGRNPHLGDFRRQLASLADIDEISQHSCSSNSTHIFTDGSCRQPDTPAHSLTAWAVVDATSDRLIARGICGGLQQSSDLGELRAIVVALEWIIDRPGHFTIWSDSAYASGGLHRLLQDIQVYPLTPTKKSGVACRRR